jgi:putative hydrolase of the HAD superfamily
MIRAIIFDIGNVLLRFDFARSVRKQRCDADVDSLLRALDPLRHAYECGKMERGEFLKRAKAALQFAGSDAEFIAAYEDIFTENLPMTQLVPSLRAQLPLYLLSNTSELHIDYITRTYPVFRFFSDAVYSHIAGCTKPARGIYELAIRQFSIVPQETVFIDDLAPNIATARELGFVTIHYEHARHGEFLDTLARLGPKT